MGQCGVDEAVWTRDILPRPLTETLSGKPALEAPRSPTGVPEKRELQLAGLEGLDHVWP